VARKISHQSSAASARCQPLRARGDPRAQRGADRVLRTPPERVARRRRPRTNRSGDRLAKRAHRPGAEASRRGHARARSALETTAYFARSGSGAAAPCSM
jgi:hypothetical protein